ncbi:histone-lysine N-methyltransferase SETDB1-B-like isoform X2 [Crassostrea angulata]|uniref:histone-lysine N-methyltransferase SETDB1-B-like isoform X2 n=1 Tax=Magallana angulata TaxID=2784310 RepID=UPI0022B142DB|nr:histone-lysine N-methyltransferase SETDB1-B-like isoform X2 [Crassostrea angulata]
MSECCKMETASTPSEMPPPQTKDVIKNGKAVVEILDSDSESDDPIYKFKFDIEDLITSTLNEFGGPERDEESPQMTETLNDLNGQIKGIERKQKEIEKIFSNCEERLRVYQQELEEADKEEMLKEVTAELEAKEAAEANAKAEETDSDDDVQIIASSFDAEIAAKNQRLQVLKIPPIAQAGSTSPTLANLRQALAGAINNSINQQQGTSPQPSSSSSSKTSTVLSSAQTKQAYLQMALEIKIGSKILGKKHNDIWYRGTVVDMSNDMQVAERTYTVKFDGKGRKTLPALNCAFKDSLTKPVSVGTRVVALYKDEESMASFYAGIVAETPNQRNAYRYLIFFDDGYAQYSRSDDIHKVLDQSTNVWDDIHQDSQEFIKDYLKQYPERPMVRLNKGQTVRTEWNGKWWTAKVEEVDSSLAKMFFLADKRIEWIYRGSTRLEPLFTALSNANKATGKMRRTNLPAGKKHVVEYTRGNSEDSNSQGSQGSQGSQNTSAGPKVVKPQKSTVPVPSFQSSVSRPASSTVVPGKKRSVARKSTTGSNQSNQSIVSSSPMSEGELQMSKWEAPWLKKRQPATNTNAGTKKSREVYSASSISSNKAGTDMASVLQERLSKVAKDEVPGSQNADFDRNQLKPKEVDFWDQPQAEILKTVTNEEREKLFDSKQSKTTKRNTTWGMKIFQDWNMEVFGATLDMQTVDVSTLADHLSRFYCEARPKGKLDDGDDDDNDDDEPLYHNNTLVNIRGAINRHLADIPRNIDIVRDKEFRTANGVLFGLFKERKRLGLSKPTRHKEIIEIRDLQKIYEYLQGARTSPVVLRHAVWYFLSIHFVTRGVDFHHQLNFDSFVFCTDETGQYAAIQHETLEENDQGGKDAHDSCTDERMYATGDEKSCPVYLLKLLLTKTDQNATNLFNKYVRDRILNPGIWFSARPLHKRTFSKFIGEICAAAGVERKYTPQCLQVTARTYLNLPKFEARHLLFMSNHRNESSLKTYNRSLSSHQKKCTSSNLSPMAPASSSSPSTIVYVAIPSAPTSFSSLPSQTHENQLENSPSSSPHGAQSLTSSRTPTALDFIPSSSIPATRCVDMNKQRIDLFAPNYEESLGERLDSVISVKDHQARKIFIDHVCGPSCLLEDDPVKYKGTNPLLIPLLCGWERHVCKIKPAYKRAVLYRAPCARRLRSMGEVELFLALTDSNLPIDLFCFDPQLHVHKEFVPVKTFCDIKDLSYGKENVPISCVNAIDRSYPDYVEYSNVRIPTKGVQLNLDPDFLACCDCTDNCRDKSKCACQQMTVDSTAVAGGRINPEAGYSHRRLQEPIRTGIYECNSKCRCDKRCVNRVAQNPLAVRLQVFKTEKRGWGLRCLDDIPAGGFICIYAGQLLTEQGANTDGQQYGDEYLAELDYMEVVEGLKEGYESNVDQDEGLGDNSEYEEEDEEEESEEERNYSDSDSDFEGKMRNSETPDNPHHTSEMRTLRTRTRKQEGNNTAAKEGTKKEACKLVLRRDSSRSTDHEEWSVKLGAPTSGDNSMNMNDVILIDDEEDEISQDQKPDPTKLEKMASNDSLDSDSLPDLDADSSSSIQSKSTIVKAAPAIPAVDPTCPKITQKFTARRSTTSRFKNLPDPKRKIGSEEHRIQEHGEEEEVRRGTRSYFQDGQACYIMDAKSQGNIGRYLNHSCNPNVFVQNVFVDTHDLRFPWVAFFTLQYVRAGTELTWDYNYEVGSVAGKVLYCYCGSSECRGRLL